MNECRECEYWNIEKEECTFLDENEWAFNACIDCKYTLKELQEDCI